jgi:membrane fusion protein (multidrug efflux system)
VWAKKQFAKLDETGKTDTGDTGVELVLADGSVYARTGVIVTANRQVDPSTGTIQLQALFPNPDELLRPGQYGRVRMQRHDIGKDALVVPEKALIPVQGAYSVGVIGDGNKVSIRRVDVGPSVGTSRIILKGLENGDRIVVEGVQKIQDGAIVDPKPAPEPATSASAPGAAPAGSAARN